MIDRGLQARIAKAAFFEKYNDIDIYVEDDSRETKKMFSLLLSRALRGKVKLESVFPLGSRNEVMESCRKDQGSGGRKRVYVIDADIDLCCRRECERLLRLYRLPRYCIENYLIDEEAACVVMFRESDHMDEDQVRRELGYSGWVQANAVPLRRLFVAFSVASNLCPRMKTTSRGYKRLVRDDRGVVEAILVEGMIADIKRSVDMEVGAGSFDVEFERVEKEHRMKSDKEFLLHYVSGKHFLLPLLRMRMHRAVRIARSMALLKVNLAEIADSSELAEIYAAAC